MAATALGHPFSTLRDGVIGFTESKSQPIPLTAMKIAIEINHGLAVITTSRSFQNVEAAPIEAVLTFPVPLDSVTTGLRAVIDGRVLISKAQPKSQARQSYEDALDRGKTAILHEEPLRGVHVLSVGQLGPGKAVEVVAEMVMPLSLVDGLPFLRIPMTVGQLYGASPLLPSDDLTAGEHALRSAELTIRVDSGTPRLVGNQEIGEFPRTVRLDRGIEISLPGARFGAAEGHDAKGRRVRLTLSSMPQGDGKIDATALFDRSGSTDAPISGNDDASPGCPEGTTVWNAMKSGLAKGLGELKPFDRIGLWQFDNGCQSLGHAEGSEAVGLLTKLGPPRGGTQLGGAIETVIASGGRDILVLTDGQTWASEVHNAAARGCRISVVLAGSASLDAMIGHLASLTGGQVFAVQGSDVGRAVRAALASMRHLASPLTGAASEGQPITLSAVRGGVRIEATWELTSTENRADAIGRYSAALALPLLGEQEATQLAVDHGLCSHLTSLFLADEHGGTVLGLPEMRKVSLAALASPIFADVAEPHSILSKFVRSPRSDGVLRYKMFPSPSQRPGASSGSEIDWDRLSNALLTGDLSGLTDDQRKAVFKLSQSKAVVALADAMRVDPAQIAIALLAEKAQGRMALRLARLVLRNAPASLLSAAQDEMTLTLTPSN